MDTLLNIPDVLQIAEQVDYRTAEFYARLGEMTHDLRLQRICYDLACTKTTHAQQHTARRKTYCREHGVCFCGSDPYDYVASHPIVMASLMGLADVSTFRWATSVERRQEEVLQCAITRGRDIVRFFTGLKGFVLNQPCIRVIDELIDQEQHHIKLLSKFTRCLMPAASEVAVEV